MSTNYITNVRKKNTPSARRTLAQRRPSARHGLAQGKHPGRGRPREFDQEKALDQALELFWRQGYEGTSIADLRAAIGITAPSLYAAFGSKGELYRRVLEHYLAGLGRTLADALREEADTFAAVKRFLLESAQKFAGPKNPRGCLISCAIPTCAPENRAVADIVASKRLRSVRTLRSRFQQAVENGELPRDTDTDQLARFYGAVIQGMSIQALDGAGAKSLRGIAETALSAWPGGTRSKLVQLQIANSKFTAASALRRFQRHLLSAICYLLLNELQATSELLAQMKVERVKYVIWAADSKRAVRFYREVFGAEAIKESEVLSEISVCGATIGIHGGGEGKRTWTGLSFQVPDVIDGAQEVVAAGGQLTREPQPEGDEPPHLAMCVDTEGNEFMLTRKR